MFFPPKDSTGKTPLGIFFSKGLSLFISVPQVFKNPALAVDSLLGIDLIRLRQPGLRPQLISVKGESPSSIACRN